MIFLIEYDRPKGSVLEIRTFANAQRSIAENSRLELELKLNRDILDHEVVLLEAATEEDLRRTHRRYFETPSQIGSPAIESVG